MQLVHPLFLIALTALAVPVLIHLFNFRKYKKVYFTNVGFLKEIQQETRKQSRLRQLLVLLMRLLAIACLVIAFAQPYIPSPLIQRKVTGRHCVSIYLDNSYSMEAVSSNGKLIDEARIKAAEIASAFSSADLFQLLTNDFEGRHQRLVTIEDFLKSVEEVKISSATRTLPEILKRQADLLLQNRNMSPDAFLISDFQKSTTLWDGIQPDSAIRWFLVPLTAEKRKNLYIDSAWFASPVHQPGQPVRLFVRIRNSSGETLDKMPIRLTLNAVQKAVASFADGANSETTVVLPYTENEPGIQYGKIEIRDFPIVYDDKYYICYTVMPSIPILCINETNPDRHLDALYGNDSAFRLMNSPVRQLDYSGLKNHSLIILDGIRELSTGLVGELLNFISNGGTLAVFPPETGNPVNYASLLSPMGMSLDASLDTSRQRISTLNLDSDLYTDVFEKNAKGIVELPENLDLPMVFRHYRISVTNRSIAEWLIRLQNNDLFLVSARFGSGKLVLFSSPIAGTASAFPTHSLFVPTLYKIALLSTRTQSLCYTAGENSLIEVPAVPGEEKNILRLRRKDGNFEIIPEMRTLGSSASLYTRGQVTEDGFYDIVSNGRIIAGIAFNYNRSESDPRCYSIPELESALNKLPGKNIQVLQQKKTSLTRQIHELQQGKPLWKWFVVMTLVFLATEIALLRLLK